MNGLKHHLRVEPYDYQREGIVYGLKHRRLIIGDEPGLGKTLQSIGIVDILVLLSARPRSKSTGNASSRNSRINLRSFLTMLYVRHGITCYLWECIR